MIIAIVMIVAVKTTMRLMMTRDAAVKALAHSRTKAEMARGKCAVIMIVHISRRMV